MMDDAVVSLEARALNAIKQGEGHFREFKSALHGPPGAKVRRELKTICKDIAETLVAFVNADGGELLVGVEDDGAVTGVECLTDAQASALRDAPRVHVYSKTPLSSFKVATLTLAGHTILYFAVLKSTSRIHLTSEGRCLQRRDLESIPIPPEEIQFSRREQVSRGYDREFVDGASIADLDKDAILIVANQISPGMSADKCLQYLELAEFAALGLRVRRAALLLFAREPTKWHPRLQIRIVRVAGTDLKTGAQYNVVSDTTVAGNVLQLLENGWDGLRPQLVQTRLNADARFSTTVMYPELACREALVNAIGHRDYSEEGRGIEIYVYDDRLEIKKPGPLLSTLDIDELRKGTGAHQSRNAMVARVLREFGYMRELGEGMRRMFELMRQNDLISPELSSDSASFSVTLRYRTVYSNAQQLWLGQFESCQLSREQKAIVALGVGEKLIAPQEVWDTLGIVDTEHYRQIVKSLQVLKVLVSAVPKQVAKRTAQQHRVSVRSIPRFKIVVRNEEEARPAVIAGSECKDGESSGASDDDSPNPSSSIYIGNIPFNASEQELVEFLTAFGTVESLAIPTDHATGRPRGFAFVEFDASASVSEVILRIGSSVFGGRKLYCSLARPRIYKSGKT